MPLRSSTHSSDVLRCDYAHPDTSHLETVHVAFAKRVCGLFFWVQVPVLAVSGEFRTLLLGGVGQKIKR
jgi:hypothetical protein